MYRAIGLLYIDFLKFDFSNIDLIGFQIQPLNINEIISLLVLEKQIQILFTLID